MRQKELSIEFRDRIGSRHGSGKGYQKMFAVLKVPKNTAASVTLKWKKGGTTMTHPRAGHPAKLSNRRRKTLTKNLMVTLTELQGSFVEMGEPSRRTTISAALHQSGLYGRVARRKHLFTKTHMTACLEGV